MRQFCNRADSDMGSLLLHLVQRGLVAALCIGLTACRFEMSAASPAGPDGQLGQVRQASTTSSSGSSGSSDTGWVVLGLLLIGGFCAYMAVIETRGSKHAPQVGAAGNTSAGSAPASSSTSPPSGGAAPDDVPVADDAAAKSASQPVAAAEPAPSGSGAAKPATIEVSGWTGPADQPGVLGIEIRPTPGGTMALDFRNRAAIEDVPDGLTVSRRRFGPEDATKLSADGIVFRIPFTVDHPGTFHVKGNVHIGVRRGSQAFIMMKRFSATVVAN